MKTSLKAVAVAAVFATALGATSAQSATLAHSGFSAQAAGTAHLYAGSYGAITPTGWTWSTDPTVVVPPDFVSGQYRSPFQNSPLGNTRDFFSVGSPAGDGGTSGTPSPVELTFGGSAIDSLNILWGSIDDYNFLEFFNGATSLGVISGAMIKALIGNPGVESVALVNIADIGGATRAVFTSDTAAFEIGFVPIPAALPLFGTALGGLLLLRSRRKRTSAAALPA